MRKKLAIMLMVCMELVSLQDITLKAQSVVNEKPVIYSGPYKMRETEKCVFESKEKKQGSISNNYTVGSKSYQLQDGMYGHGDSDVEGKLLITMDGESNVPLSWSQTTYKNVEGKEMYMGAVKPEENEKWSDKTALIWHTEGVEKHAALYVTASPDGPRDLKIERSLDGGKNFKVIGTVSLKNTGQVQNVFDGVSYEYEGENFNEMFNWSEVYRVSIASDYKLDGSKGLYESNCGEWIINGIYVYESWVAMGNNIVSFHDINAYKVSDSKVKLSWNEVEDAHSYDIYQKEGKGDFQKIHTINKTGVKKYSYIVNRLKKGKTYTFYVKATLTYNEVSSNPSIVDMKKQLLPKDIKLVKKIKLKKGKKKQIPLKYKKGTDKSFVKEIKYTVNKKKVLKIKNDKIIAKKKGTALVKVKIVLKSGLKKTLKTKVIVK